MFNLNSKLAKKLVKEFSVLNSLTGHCYKGVAFFVDGKNIKFLGEVFLLHKYKNNNFARFVEYINFEPKNFLRDNPSEVNILIAKVTFTKVVFIPNEDKDRFIKNIKQNNYKNSEKSDII